MSRSVDKLKFPELNLKLSDRHLPSTLVPRVRIKQQQTKLNQIKNKGKVNLNFKILNHENKMNNSYEEVPRHSIFNMKSEKPKQIQSFRNLPKSFQKNVAINKNIDQSNPSLGV